MKTLSDHRYWIFDLDGTLTKPVHDFAAIRLQLGIPENEDILSFIAKQNEPEKEHLNQQLIRIEEDLSAKAVANEGALSALEFLHTKGYQLGIFTRNKRHCVDIALEQIGCLNFFDPHAIIASEMLPPKPDPAGIHYLMDLWDAEKSETVMMGDYLFDLEAGKSAEVTTIHFADESGPFWPDKTDHRVLSFAELMALLR